jgi:hypothetical protein
MLPTLRGNIGGLASFRRRRAGGPAKSRPDCREATISRTPLPILPCAAAFFSVQPRTHSLCIPATPWS